MLAPARPAILRSLAVLLLLVLLLVPPGSVAGGGAHAELPRSAGLGSFGRPLTGSPPRALLAGPTPQVSSTGWDNLSLAYGQTAKGATPVLSTGTAGAQQFAYDAADGYAVFLAHGWTWTYGSKGWANDTIGTTAPPVTKGYSMAYDPVDGYVLLYGGCCGGAGSWPQAQTWKFQGGVWTNLTSVVNTPPPPRTGALLTWDGADNEMVLINGVENYSCGAPQPCSAPLAQTWTYRAGVWTNLTSTALAPPARLVAGSAAAYDGPDGYVLWVGSGLQSDVETWSFHAGTWTNLTSTAGALPPREYGTLIAGPTLGYVLLFGGTSCYGVGCTPTYLGDTWRFQAGVWTNLTSGLIGPPPDRAGGFGVYDAGLGYDLLMDGTSCASSCNDLNDTWEYSFPLAAGVPSSVIPSGRLDVQESTTFSSGGFGGSGSYYYGWNGLPYGCLPANSASIACTPTTAGTYAINVTITDTNGAHVNSPTLDFTVNAAPTISSFLASPRSVTLPGGTNLTTVVSGGTSPFTYSYVGLPDGCSSMNTSLLSCDPNATGEYTVYVDITDAWHKFNQAELWLWVNPSTLVVGTPTTTPGGTSFDAGETIQFRTDVAGGSGHNYYSWTGLPTDCAGADTPWLNCTLKAAGNYSVAVTVVDSNGTSVTSTPLSLQVSPKLVLSFFAAEPFNLVTGQTTLFTTIAYGGSAPLSYVYTGLPTGCASVDAPSVNCTVTIPGSYNIEVNVTDLAGTYVTQATSLLVTGLPYLNAAVPTISPDLLTIDQGLSTTLMTVAGGGDGGYSYVWNGLPSGCTSANGPLLPCTPGSAGPVAISVTVTDRAGASATSAPLNLTINPLPRLTSLTAFPAAPTVGTKTLFNATFTGGTGPFTFVWAGLPPGCQTSNASSLVCAPAQQGTLTVRIVLTDHFDRTAEDNLTLTVAPAPASTPAGVAGVPYVEVAGLVVIAFVAALVLAILYMRRGRSGSKPKRSPDRRDQPEDTPRPKQVAKRTSPAPRAAAPKARSDFSEDDEKGD